MVKQPPVLKKRQLTPKQRNTAHCAFGDEGEELACLFLIEHGYTILERNVRLKTYEVDIIALDTKEHEVVFIEVKRRTAQSYGQPYQAVGYKKIRSLTAVAHAYLATHTFPLDVRFDIISIVDKKVEQYKNITGFS